MFPSSGTDFLFRHWHTGIVVIFVLAATVAPSAAATTPAQDIDVSLDVPDEVTAGQRTTISASISVSDSAESYETALKFALYVDDEIVEKRRIQVENGTSRQFTFSHTFESTGNYTVKLQGTSVNGPSLPDSPSASVTVVDGPDPITLSGPAFTVPDSLSDDVERHRSQVPKNVTRNAFVLATADQLYLVFSDRQLRKGVASVTGVPVGQQFRSDGLEYTVIAARNASFESRGSRTTVANVTSNATEHQHELVRIRATHRQVSSLSDPDQGVHTTGSSSLGALVANPATPNAIFDRVASQARSLTVNGSTDELGSNTKTEIHSLLGEPNLLYTFDFDAGFWTSAEATVDGVVLPPDSEARAFVSTYDEGEILENATSQPLLYVVGSELDYEEYDDVSAAKWFSRKGDLVTVETRFVGRVVSVQETLEERTDCGPNRMAVRSPSSPDCVDVVRDNLVHFGVGWSDTQSDRNGSFFVIGVSARHLDEPSTERRGRYRIAGEIVSTSRIDPSLPDGKVLVAHDLNRMGSLDDGNRSEDVKQRHQDRFEQLNETIHAQLRGTDGERTTSTGTPNATTTRPTETTRTGGGNSTATIEETGTDTADGTQGLPTPINLREQGGDGGLRGLPGFGVTIGGGSVILALLFFVRMRRRNPRS